MSDDENIPAQVGDRVRVITIGTVASIGEHGPTLRDIESQEIEIVERAAPPVTEPTNVGAVVEVDGCSGTRIHNGTGEPAGSPWMNDAASRWSWSTITHGAKQVEILSHGYAPPTKPEWRMFTNVYDLVSSSNRDGAVLAVVDRLGFTWRRDHGQATTWTAGDSRRHTANLLYPVKEV